MWTYISTRPNLNQIVAILSQFFLNPTIKYFNVIKHVQRYLQAIKDYKLIYLGRDQDYFKLKKYNNAN